MLRLLSSECHFFFALYGTPTDLAPRHETEWNEGGGHKENSLVIEKFRREIGLVARSTSPTQSLKCDRSHMIAPEEFWTRHVLVLNARSDQVDSLVLMRGGQVAIFYLI